jgi:hypothetical protein
MKTILKVGNSSKKHTYDLRKYKSLFERQETSVVSSVFLDPDLHSKYGS